MTANKKPTLSHNCEQEGLKETTDNQMNAKMWVVTFGVTFGGRPHFFHLMLLDCKQVHS